jgi:penicillin-binding protein 1B
MSAAVLKLDKSFKSKNREQTEKIKIRRYAAHLSAAERRRFVLKKILVYGGFLAFVCLAFICAGFYYFYSQAAAAVDRRVQLGFWQTRSGVYAAPHVLRAGQKINTAELVSMLRHAGYVEGEGRNIWNGNFTVQDDTILIQTNQSFNEQPETIAVEISRGHISEIKSGNRRLESYELQPEMISGNSETKRGSVNTLKFEQIPEVLRKAILVTEDRRFFEHFGLDYRAIFRALRRNLSDNRIVQGGSTLTQQFAKNVFLSGERTFSRKFSEMFLALALENRLSKEEIFALYCNEIYLGQYGATGIHGVEQASRAYFGKPIEKLTLSEAATLAAMIKSPRRYAPNLNLEASKERRNLVIDKMLEEGLITPDEAGRAKSEEIALAPPKKNNQSLAPYFVDEVTKTLSEMALPEQRNLRVYSTIDPQLQETAESVVNSELAKFDKIYAKRGLKPQAALVALNPKNGHVVAMVGGRDYAESQHNRATSARRQPGSTFKPFVYAAALENGKLPTSVALDQPTAFAHGRKTYKPANYNHAYAMREITLKTALAKSSNVAAVETALEIGLGPVVRTAEKFGLSRPPAYPSVALGTGEATPLEMAAAYAAFVNEGKRVKPTFVSRILSGEGNVVFESKNETVQVISPQTAYMITDMLGAAVERGSARAAFGALGERVAFVGKTGSSKDGWFVGYTPNLVCAVWIGFDEGDEDIGLTGGESALPVWVDFMRRATEARPEFGGAEFPMPAGLTEVTVDPETGMLADDRCPQREKVVVPTRVYSNIYCLRHQPKTEILPVEKISIDETFTLPAASEYEVAAETVYADESSPAEAETKNAVPAYKSVNGIPTARETDQVKPSRPNSPGNEKPVDAAAETNLEWTRNEFPSSRKIDRVNKATDNQKISAGTSVKGAGSY